jgi:ribonuclease R
MFKRVSKLPKPSEIVDFIKEMEGQPISKRELAKHFQIKGQESRAELKKLLKDLVDTGVLKNDKAKTYIIPEAEKDAPEVDTNLMISLNVSGETDDGELYCIPVNQNQLDDFPLIILDKASSAVVGDTITAMLHPEGEDTYIAKVVAKKEKHEEGVITGVYKPRPNGPALFIPLAKSLSNVDFVIESIAKGLKVPAGAVVSATVGKRPNWGPTPVKVDAVVSESLAGAEISIAIRNHDLPHQFPEDVLAYAQNLKPIADADLKDREDLRNIPLVTIDGEDAKDFDDAVWAEPYSDSKIKNGWHIIVAIADVAHYVKVHSDLDKEAFNRGNSTYFPGYVIPMLPEELSNDLCSLRPHEDRPTMVAHMYIDAKGKLKKYKFTRAVIHSHARLTYNQVQAALDGEEIPEVVAPVFESTIQPLFGAYKALLTDRAKRGTLELEIPETYIDMEDDGKIVGIKKRERFDSHKLIEEMMVLANVAAASQLQTKGAECLYRIHPEPGDTKLSELKLAFQDLGVKLDASGGMTPGKIQNAIGRVKDEDKEGLYFTVLRSQEQARYDKENVGHFGLALERYAHFTSPIRRYSDLVVHRSLIQTLKLTGHKDVDDIGGNLDTLADHLCITERRSQKAEWEAKDRLTVRFYNEFVGKAFNAKITTITNFGMFISVDGGIAEGLLPYRHMNDDHYIFDEKTKSLFGKRTKKKYKVGSEIKAVLTEADEVNGRLTFQSEAGKGNTNRPNRTSRSKGRFKATKSDVKKARKFKEKPTQKKSK